jgi:glucosyl-dolichyl phosphate glucuronosyltransferase
LVRCSEMERANVCSVSVVVPSKNRPHEIMRLLASLYSQPTRPLEVLVVDQSTPAYDLDAFPDVCHYHAPQLSGLTAARNAGITRTRGDVVLFFDDDVILESDCVSVIGRLFGECPDLIGAQCSIHNVNEEQESLLLHNLSVALFERGFFNMRPMRRGRERTPRCIDGLASAYRRELFNREQFDETFTGYCLAEDWDFTKRAARHGKLLIAEDARVRHEHSPNNRHDVATYLRMRWQNVLYLYEKLEADSDFRNRFWRYWWMLGERLRAFRLRSRIRPSS